jgi:hypothetical protein
MALAEEFLAEYLPELEMYHTYVMNGRCPDPQVLEM